ncbi:MAG: DUF6807 family protein [Bythopirellula sp.]|nr:DUF6807 family protein [Bythopirellula sp.]
MSKLFFLLSLLTFSQAVAEAEVSFETNETGKLRIMLDGQHFADYVFQDPTIPRPYFAAVHAPSGVQVTRNHPPDLAKDVADHPLFHPGIWLSFGILSDLDYWRNAARVEHVDFPEPPASSDEGGVFTSRFRYLDQNDLAKVVCEELFQCRILPRPTGTLIIWDSTFSSEREFTFGDQEEMGLGIRLATPLRSEPQARGEIPPGTGTILDAEGRKNGAEVWGHTAPWCDFSGTFDGKPVGATLFCHPNNFRPSWFHARDYGLLVANPFGRKAFHQGEVSNVVVKPGEKFHLRYGILLHSDAAPDLDAAYQDYIKLAASEQ